VSVTTDRSFAKRVCLLPSSARSSDNPKIATVLKQRVIAGVSWWILRTSLGNREISRKKNTRGSASVLRASELGG
jgi:hypothetical protein